MGAAAASAGSTSNAHRPDVDGGAAAAGAAAASDHASWEPSREAVSCRDAASSGHVARVASAGCVPPPPPPSSLSELAKEEGDDGASPPMASPSATVKCQPPGERRSTDATADRYTTSWAAACAAGVW